MRASPFLSVSWILWVTAALVYAGPDITEIRAPETKHWLLGTHDFSLHWIGNDPIGRITVAEQDGVLTVKGSQEDKKSGNYITVEGIITQVEAKAFTFKGTIVTRVAFVASGKPVRREGAMMFAVTKDRDFFRLQQMDNPDDAVVDYIDIYPRR